MTTLENYNVEESLQKLSPLKRTRVNLLLKKFNKHVKKLEEIQTEIEGYGMATESNGKR